MDIERTDIGRNRFRNKVAAGAAGAVVLALVVLAWSLSSRAPQLNTQNVWRGKVSRGELIREITAPGVIAAPEIRAITNGSEGVVERIRVLPGRTVEPDTVLVEMSSPQLEDELEKARLAVTAAEAEQSLAEMDLDNRYRDVVAELARAQAEFTSSRLELDAKERLPGVISALEIERMRLRTQQLQRQLDAQQGRHDGFERFRKAQQSVTKAKLSGLRQEVAHLATRVEGLHVRAGIAGVVQEVNVQEGERLAPGQPVVRIVNPSKLIARLSVSEREAALVRTGLPVTVQVGEERLEARVTRIDPTVRDHLVTVDADFVSEETPQLRPDLSVMSRVELERVEKALVLDRPAGMRGEFQAVELFVVQPDGKHARRVRVEVGRASARQIEILGGLREGDEVILSQLPDYQNESVIRIG